MDTPPKDLRTKPALRSPHFVAFPALGLAISVVMVISKQYLFGAVVFSFTLYYALTVTVPYWLLRITQREVKAGKFASAAKLATFGVEWCRIFFVQQINLLPRSFAFDLLLKRHLSTSLMSLGRLEDAIKVDLEILAEIEKQGDIDGAAYIRGKLSSLYLAKGDFKEADRFILSNIAILESAARNAEIQGDIKARVYIVHLASALFSQAWVLETKKNYAAAEPIRRRDLVEIGRIFEEDAREVMPHLSMLGRLLIHLKRYDEAETALMKVLDVRTKTYPPKHILISSAKHGVGLLYSEQGKLELAEPLLREALEIVVSNGPEHPEIPNFKKDLAKVLFKRGLYSEAEQLLISAIDQMETQRCDTHIDLIEMLTPLAEIKRATGDTKQADSLIARAEKIREQISG